MATPVKTKTTYFIDSGRLNAMYTLKRAMTGGEFYHESYICNLSTDPDKAEQKARDYFDRVTARIQDTDQHETVFAGYADFELGQRRGKLSILDTERIERVESGVFPFGKHEGKKFSEVPESYVLFFADKSNNSDNNAVMAALSGACLGYALENGYIAAREQKREEKRTEDLKSEWIGEVGKRQLFEGEIVFSYEKIDYYNQSIYHITKIKQGNDLIIYFGKKLGDVGETIKLKGTVKKHDSYQDIKTTVINRPAIVA